jgi:hypothetical protein
VKADVKNKTVTTNKGDVFQYGTLLVATGSTVSVLSLLIVATWIFSISLGVGLNFFLVSSVDIASWKKKHVTN